MRVLFLDTETTGLTTQDQIIEIAIVDQIGKVLLNTLVNPGRVPINPHAEAAHGITASLLRGAPSLADLWPQIRSILSGNRVVIYNAKFDRRFFPDNLACAGLVECAMQAFVAVRGVKSARLAEAAAHVGHVWVGDAHRALADTQALRSVWLWLPANRAVTQPPKPASSPVSVPNTSPAAALHPLAAAGHAAAQFALGKLYASGRGIPQDYVFAHLWLNLAAAAGLEEAQIARDLVAGEMTKTGIAEAQKLAREWRAEPLPRGTLGDYEFCGPDYAQLGLWARALKLSLETVLERLTAATIGLHRHDAVFGLQVVDGAIRSAVLDLKALPLRTFEWLPGLQLRQLGVKNGGKESAKMFSGRLPALTGLYCHSNQLIELDLSGVPELSTLVCFDNQLTELDLSGVPALTELRCHDSQLTDLDLTGVPALTTLHCHGNQLTELDLSGVPELSTLVCFDNQLTELDLSGVPALTWLSCESNQLTELDLSGVPALTGLYCEDNSLFELDLSDVPALTSLNCVNTRLFELDLSGVPALTSLYCEHNQFTELDLSGVPALTTLHCHGNQLTELNLRKQKKLEDFRCDDSVKVHGDARYKQN